MSLQSSPETHDSHNINRTLVPHDLVIGEEKGQTEPGDIETGGVIARAVPQARGIAARSQGCNPLFKSHEVRNELLKS
jgi:hypothetical protein